MEYTTFGCPKPAKELGGIDDIRVCSDFKKVNSIIQHIPDSSLPHIREVIDRLEVFKWITILDLADSYQQFPICEEDQVKTAFTCPGREQEMFITVPYGLKIMTEHMQRLMEKLLEPLGKVPFQDDTAVVSVSTEDHIKDVKEVLERITYVAGLRLQINKCQFF